MRKEATINRTATGPMQIALEELLIRCHPLEQRTMIICVRQQSMNLFQDPQNCSKGLISLYHFVFFSVNHYFYCYYFIGLLLKILVKTHGFIRNSGNTKALMIDDMFGKNLLFILIFCGKSSSTLR